MSDQEERSQDPLETELRGWFRSAGTRAAPATLRAFVERLATEKAPTARIPAARVGWRAPAVGRLEAIAAAVAVLLVASSLLVVVGRLSTGPGSSVSVPPVSSTPLATAVRPTPSLTPPTAIDDGGIFGKQGIWAATGDRLNVLTNGTVRWVSRVPAPGFGLDLGAGDALSSVFVLDATHAWTASPGPGSTVPYTGQGPTFDHLHVVVNRTTDAGASWHSVVIPGDWGGTQPIIAFADTRHGFVLLASLRAGPGSTVFATDDGGATWRHVGGLPGLGSVFTATDRSTLWAGNQGDAGPVSRDILDISRDGGRTWSDARLPGLDGDHFVNDTVVAPPLFVGADGAVAVIAASTDNPPDVRFYRTRDGGRTWSLSSRVDLNANGSNAVAVADPTHFVVIDPQAGTVATTGDGGLSWTNAPSMPLGAVTRLRFWDPQNGVAIVQLSNGPAPAAGLYRTADGGQTWTPVTFPPSG